MINPENHKSTINQENISPCTCNDGDGSCEYHLGYANGYTLGLVAKKHTNSFCDLKEVIEESFKENCPGSNNALTHEYQSGYKEGQEAALAETTILVKGAIAQHSFSLADIEFGETYHIAGALIFSPDTTVNISFTSKNQMLFLLTLTEHKQIFFEQGLRNYYTALKENEKITVKNNTTHRFEQATRIIMEMFGHFYTQRENIGFRPRSYYLNHSSENNQYSLFFINKSKNEIAYTDLNIDEKRSSSINRALAELSNPSGGKPHDKKLDEVKKALFSERNQEAEKAIFKAFTYHLTKAVPNLESRFLNYLRNKLGTKINEESNEDKIIIVVRRVKSPDKNENSSTAQTNNIDRAEWRNLSPNMLIQIVKVIDQLKIKQIILTGDIKDNAEIDRLQEKFTQIKFHNMNEFFNQKEFLNIVGINSVAGQIYFYHILHKKFAVKYITGMMSGAIDGAAFIGVPTFFFTNGDSRMMNASQCIPGLKPISYQKDENNIKLMFDSNPSRTAFSNETLQDFKKQISIFHPPERPTDSAENTSKNTVTI